MSILLSLKQVPTSKLSGLDTLAGNRIEYTSGEFNFSPVANIVNATGATVTLVPDTAYKITATTSAVTLDATVPPDGQWAYEGHVEIFVAGTGYVQTTSNVVLANALEPDAVNNCTVRFHDGLAIVAVEDHVAGYIVTVNAASGAGSLAYGLSTATNEYISIDASLNGQTLDLAGVTTSAGVKHVVGNGYTSTTLSGGIVCTSRTTFSNLSMQNVAVNGGVMVFGDVEVPSGSTVGFSGGSGVFEKVTGGGTLNFGTSSFSVASNTTQTISGVVVTGQLGSNAAGGCFVNYGTLILSGGTALNSFVPGTAGGGFACISKGLLYAENQVFSGCSAGDAGALLVTRGATATILGGSFVSNTSPNCGAIGNLNTTIISGASFVGNSGNIGGVIINNNDANGILRLVNCVASSNYASTAGSFLHEAGGAVANIISCTITGNTDSGGYGAINHTGSTVLNVSDSVLAGNTPRDLRLNGGSVTVKGSTVAKTAVSSGTLNLVGNNTISELTGTGGGTVVISSGASIALTSSINPGGTGKITVLTGGCTVNGNAIAAGTYTKIDSTGTPT